MAPAIKSIRGLLASVRGSVTMDPASASLDDAMKKILGHQHAATWSDVAFSNIIKCEDGLAVLQALRTEYFIHKVVHCKKRPRKILQDVVEHEFVVVHLRHKGKDLMLRIDRAIGPKSTKHQEKKCQSTASDSSSGRTAPSTLRSSRSSSSVESILMYPSRLINYCVCRLSNISSPRHWARDTILQISKTPDESYALTTIDFTRSTSTWPSLWDLVHLVQFINNQCDEYSVVDAQCYWYADMISGILEFWCQDATVIHHHGWQGTRSRELSIPTPGTCKGISIHRRDPELIFRKKAALIKAIKASNKTTEKFLDLSKGRDRTVQRIRADADAQIEILSRQLRETELKMKEGEERAEARVKAVEERAEARVNRAEEEVRKMARQMKQGEERAEARVKAVEERAEIRVKEVEERAEAKVVEMGRQMKESEERAEARVKGVEDRYESKIQELSMQLQQSRDVVNAFEERASARDDLMERIMAHLSKHNAGNPITL
ncbi:hypothetical protein AX15_003861 [Amanita polypyramis BW_CC]|nr:hypothetical protein AX15_003861 [Amanita polypyramis BW_CC]